MRGKLIAFSGLDGAGKSTQIALLAEAYRRRGIEPKIFWSRVGYTPGFNPLKAAARKIFGRSGTLPPSGQSEERTRLLGRPSVRAAWLTIALLDLAFSYGVLVRWWRFRGKTVICDRYLWDSLVDLEINHGETAVPSSWLWKFVEAVAPRPDAAFCFVVPVEESVRRSAIKGEPFPDIPLTLSRRLRSYADLDERAGWLVIDGRDPRDDIARRIFAESGYRA